MAPPRQQPLKVEDLQGFRYLRNFAELWQPLRDCAIDPSRNRSFFFDQYLALLLLYFFTPTLTSLRGLQQAAKLSKVQQATGLEKAPALGTLSAAAHDFDPELLKPILAELAERAVPVVDGHEAKALAGLTAVDGSIFDALPRMAWALWMDPRHRRAKLHLHFDVVKGVPCRAEVSPAACSEIEHLEGMLEAGRFYVLDRGYACYSLLGSILAADSSFLVRLKADAAYTVREERPISAAAAEAGVTRDVIAKRLGTPHHKDEVGREVRLIWVVVPDAREGEAKELLLCTDKLDLEAELVALGYRRRWWIELFFRWLKCILGCRHLLSESQSGVTIQIYVALIASLLVSLSTGRKPTKRTYEMLCLYFAGLASAEELRQHIDDLGKPKKSRTAAKKDSS